MKAMLSCVYVLAIAGPLLVACQYNGQYSGYQGQQAGPYPGQVPQGDQPQIATNYNTVDGQQRSESVDGQGNVRGQYSYVDPNGKTITLKYSAGKDGFQVEGDHLPRSPALPAAGPPAQAPQGQYNQYQGQQQYQEPQQYQQYQQPQQQYQPQQYQQPQQLQGFPQQPQHRFGGSGSGEQVSVSQNSGAGYNYQFSFQ